MIREEVKALGERGRTDVTRVVEHGGEIEFPTMNRVVPLRLQSDPGASIVLRDVDALALVAWVMGPALVEKLDAEIDQVADDATAVAPERRTELLAKIDADILPFNPRIAD